MTVFLFLFWIRNRLVMKSDRTLATGENGEHRERPDSGRSRVTKQVPAAQYLRMSTDHQQFSLDNQADHIKQYADSHGFAVIRTYSDGGRSGLLLRNRSALKQLLQDVLTGEADYKAILVYDISRWGRFQDADEAAHYEFLCKSAGVPVHYCAELFTNDETATSSILKALKRSMAAEFSRELGVKSYAGQKRLVELGYRMGGSPGYGLRRLLLSASKESKQVLSSGEYKSLTTDRVILVPGAREEIETVRRIFQLALQKKGPVWVAQYLNERGVPYLDGRSWSNAAVSSVLTNPKYMGTNRWGTTTQKLHTKKKVVPSTDWIVRTGAFEAIVSKETFDQAQQILADHTRNKSDHELLDRLRRLWKKRGIINQTIIDRSRSLPSVSAFRCRFGSLRKAYELIGYQMAPRYRYRGDLSSRTRALREDFVRSVQQHFPEHIAVERGPGNLRPFFRVDGLFLASVILCPFSPLQERPAKSVLYAPRTIRDVVVVLCSLDKTNQRVERVWVMPRITCRNRWRFTPSSAWLREGIIVGLLPDLYQALLRAELKRTTGTCAV
jgi:DNA invertase Pin-like site-specific DNA recombinase